MQNHRPRMVIQRVIPHPELKQESNFTARFFAALPFIVIMILVSDFCHRHGWNWRLGLVQAGTAVIIVTISQFPASVIGSAIRRIKLYGLRRRRSAIKRRLRIQTSDGTPYRTLSSIPMEALLRWRIEYIPDQCSDDEKQLANLEAHIAELEMTSQKRLRI